MGSNEAQDVPTIDFSDKNMKPGTEEWKWTRERVREAMELHGWFVAEYDNFPEDLHRRIVAAAEELLCLPREVKLRNANHKAGHGYITLIADDHPVHEGLGIDHVTDFKHCCNFARLMWPDHGTDHGFCETVHAYAKMQAELEEMVIRMLFESYGVDEKCLDRHVGATRYLLRLLKYTRLPNGEANRKFISHTDKSFVSILHQNHIKGLSLKSEEDNIWYPFSPSPTRFAVIAGDAIMAWSNDRIKACYHKVEMDSDETRYSLGFFSFQDGTISTPEELVDEQHPLAYKPFLHDGLLEFYDSLAPHLKAHRTMTKSFCGIEMPSIP